MERFENIQRPGTNPGTGTAYYPTALPTIGPYALPVSGFVPESGTAGFGFWMQCSEVERFENIQRAVTSGSRPATRLKLVRARPTYCTGHVLHAYKYCTGHDLYVYTYCTGHILYVYRFGPWMQCSEVERFENIQSPASATFRDSCRFRVYGSAMCEVIIL